MLKKSAVIFMALLLSAGCLTACSDNTQTQNSGVSVTSETSSEESQTSVSENNDNSVSETSAQTVNDNFSDGDYKDVTSQTPNAEITLSGNEGTISDTTRGSSGSEVTITSKGVYRVSGTSEEVSIVINDDTKSGNIYLILDGVSMTNEKSPCIYVEACDKVIIQCVGENSLVYNNSDTQESKDGAVYAKDDITVNGEGTLNITSKLHGIVCKDDLKITGANINVNSDYIGIKSGSSLRIGGGVIDIDAQHDGIQVSDNDNDSCFYFVNADLTVNAGFDGISVVSGDEESDNTISTVFESGKINIISGGGSDNSKGSNSQKGIKSDGDINIDGTDISVSSADDAIHGNAGMIITSGTLKLSTSDDGITVSDDLVVNGGTIDITKSYEGFEGSNIEINDGEISIISSDDGINTAGGSDTTASDDNPWNSTSTDANLTVNGGYLYVNSSGDGLDSNGSIYITGGTVIVEGSTANDNGALDKGDGSGCVASITGGTVLALGSSGMAVNFDTGTQCSALVTVSGSNGTAISVDDGSDFTFTATKEFACAVYSSPNMTQGNSYTLSAGSDTVKLDFSDSLYYSDVSGGMGGMGGFGDNRMR